MTPLAAQPTAVVNVASFANPNLPNGDIAQGSMFTVFGSNIGPASVQIVSAFPLPNELGGTSIQVTVGGQTIDCIMIFSLSSQVAAVLPSGTPTGSGTLTLTYNGQSGAPIPITVVANSFGTFGINQAGSGPGVLTNAANPLSVNTVLNTAVSGEMWDIWGTGLGAVQGDEAAGPLPGNLPLDVSVFVGSAEAQVVYKGRSGCCVGIDQVRFVVPDGLVGCFVPITVVVSGVPSNFTTMAISEGGGACSDPATGIDANVLSQAQANGELRIGSIAAARTRTTFNAPPGFPGQSFTSVSDSIGAFFERFTVNQVESISGFAEVGASGGCVLYQFRDSTGQDIPDPVVGTGVPAGNLTLNGPEGMRPIPNIELGEYFDLLTSGFSFLRAVAAGKSSEWKGQFPGGTPYFQQGQHTVTGSGGSGSSAVGAFSAGFEVGSPLTVTNPTDSIPRDSSHEVRWQGGSGDKVVIFGFSAYDFADDSGSGAAFFCLADRGPGSFTIRQDVLGGLPAPSRIEGLPAGAFGVGSQSTGSFSASGLDIGLVTFSDMNLQFGVDFP